MNFSPEYEAYMCSEEWKTLRSRHPSPRQCVACDATYNLRLHHMIYPEDIWKTQPHHCCWLCEGCRDAFHRACTGERKKYQAWATEPWKVKMIVQAQRKEEGWQSAGDLLKNMRWEQRSVR